MTGRLYTSLDVSTLYPFIISRYMTPDPISIDEYYELFSMTSSKDLALWLAVQTTQNSVFKLMVPEL